MPSLLQYLRAAWPSVVDEFLATAAAEDPAAIALSFCAFVVGQLDPGPVTGEPVLRDAVRYQAARIRASYDFADAGPPFAVVDQLGGRNVTEAVAGPLHPVRSNHLRVEEFDHDVCLLFPPWTADDTPPAAPADHFDDVVARHLLVAFLHTPNLIPRELEIDLATRELLARCDGQQTTSAVITDTLHALGAPDDSDARKPVVAALDRLYRLGVIVFGAPDPVWGWRNGPRTDVAAIPPLTRSAPAAVHR